MKAIIFTFSGQTPYFLGENPKTIEDSRKGGLNIVNNTNLDYFSPKQKAELFRLKAEFLSLLGGNRKANQAYCQATQICPNYGKTWLSWGEHCLLLAANVKPKSSGGVTGSEEGVEGGEEGVEGALGGTKEEDVVAMEVDNNEGEELAKEKEGGEEEDTGENDEGGEEKQGEKFDNGLINDMMKLKAQAMGCFMESVRCGNEKARLMLARCLWMVRDDGDEPGHLCKTLEDKGVWLPEWVWIPYIPNLLTSLGRTEGKAAKKLLEGVMKRYPQALYYPLRSFYLQRRDVGGGGKGSSGEAAEDLMNGLRKSHPALWSKLEGILDELMYRFRPSLEEELLGAIDALLKRCNSLRNGDSGGKGENALPQSMITTLANVHSKFFEESGGGKGKVKAKNKKSMLGGGEGDGVGGGIGSTTFNERYSDLFKKQFISPAPKNLDVVVKRLKIWKKRLMNYVSSTPSEINLQHVSAPLSQLSCEAPDLWAGSCDHRGGSKGGNISAGGGSGETVVVEAPTGGGKGQAAAAAAAAASAVAAAAAAEGGLGGGAAAMEIPGQYNPLKSDGKPSPELHSKLLKFGSKVTIVEREGSLRRRIEMRGTDGETHYFLLHFTILHIMTSDERLGQIHNFVNKLLKRGSAGARRRHVEMQTQPVVSLSQRMRLVRDDPRNMSLEEAWEGEGSLEELEGLFGAWAEEAGGGNEGRLSAYRRICDEKVGDNLLLKHMIAKLDGPEALWSFRKTFSLQLGAESCINYAFSCQNRTPGNFIINAGNGRIGNIFQPNYSSSGRLEDKGGEEEEEEGGVPFRLTRNVAKLVGKLMIRGSFVPTIGSISESIVGQKETMEAMLGLVLTDDLMSWHVSKSGSKNDEETRKLEKHLKERTESNIRSVMDRFKQMSFREGETENETDVAVDSGIHKLVAKAMSEEELCKVKSAGFCPWF